MRRFGTTEFLSANTPQFAILMFNVRNKEGEVWRIRYNMPLPQPEEFEGPVRSNQYKQRTAQQIAILVDKETDRRWRALVRGIEGKLILVESDIESIEQAFYANVVVPDGSPMGTTVYEATHEPIKQAYATGQIPPLLPGIRIIERQISGKE